MIANPLRTNIFISYSHANADVLDRLPIHLDPLKRLYGIQKWCDRDIMPGDNWEQQIETALNKCQVAVLLVSPDFLASRFY